MSDGGTGKKFAYGTTVVAGVASLSATLLSIVYVRSSCHSSMQNVTQWN